MAKTHKTTWKRFESRPARDLARVLRNKKIERKPLSGRNSKQGAGDHIVPDEFTFFSECKLAARFAHHSTFDVAYASAKKDKRRDTLLFTQRKHSKGYLVTMHRDTFLRLLRYGADALRKNPPRLRTAPNGSNDRMATAPRDGEES
jgi:hypothetical protein